MASLFPTQEAEANALIDVIRDVLPVRMTGKIAIEVMRSEGSRNWKQMEWIGFWFEHLVENQVIPKTGGSRGPEYGRTRFDFKRNHVWDLKVHLDQSDWLILNDQEAVHDCMQDNNGLGYLVVEGSADYDESGDFKQWHDDLKGGASNYERERIKRGAPSRRRKISFRPSKAMAIWIPSGEVAQNGVRDGWLKGFQEGMRNSNGNSRRAKFQIQPQKVPHDYVLVNEQF